MAEQRNVPNIPYRTPLVNTQGIISEPWAKFFRQLFLRVGENVALTNIELEEQIDAGVNPLPQTTHTFTGGQAATNLTGESFDHTVYSSAFVVMEISRGATLMVRRLFDLQYVDGAWNIVDLLTGRRSAQTTAHGITLSMNGDQLRAAADVGSDGKIKIKKVLFEI